MAMEDWWSEIDDEVQACLKRYGAMTPGEIAQHLGLSEGAISSVVSLLAQEGKLRIARVELFDHPPGA
jgi:DNA-directed RNA polymerase specialized sigma24 family protein